MSGEVYGVASGAPCQYAPTSVVRSQHCLDEANICSMDSAMNDDTPGVPTQLSNMVTGLRLDDGHNKANNYSPHSSKLTESTAVRPPCSVRLIDEEEKLLFDSAEQLAHRMGCPVDQAVKLIAIVGNTGDGKSHTLNHTFCGGTDVFTTSASQVTCTIGVWAAYLPKEKYVLVDTEGLLGASPNPNRQRRLLLKVFALADIVIYRTMSDRLHSDMFTFLADASDAFNHHFRPDLEALAARYGLPWTTGQLGPAVVIFQETQHTIPLDEIKSTHSNPAGHPTISETAQDLVTQLNSKCMSYMSSAGSCFLIERLAAMKRNTNAFSVLQYVGTQTKLPPTNFQPLASTVAQLARDSSVRRPRKLQHIFTSLTALNSRFSSDLPAMDKTTFVEEYFTCPAKCTSCGLRCRLGVNHQADNQRHVTCAAANSQNEASCRYDPALENKLYFCKLCYSMGHKTMMVPKSCEGTDNTISAVVKYLWSGYVLECPRHGTVYRSRAFWSGNVQPEETSQVHWEVVHIWPGEKSVLKGTHPVGQLVIDGLTQVSTHVSHFAGPPARRLGDMIADSVAPAYWQPNSSIKACSICKMEFPTNLSPDETLDSLSRTPSSANSRGARVGPPIHLNSPEGENPQRPNRSPGGGTLLFPRSSTITTLTSSGNSEPNKKTSPPRAKLPQVSTPQLKHANEDVTKHHCRACGRGVCAACSTGRMQVPERGYISEAVRVCDNCYESLLQSTGRPASNKSSGGSVVDTPVDRNDRRSRKSTPSELSVNPSPSGAPSGRRVIEMLTATAGYVAPMYTAPKELVKSLVRPDYWQPDEECVQCGVCKSPFGAYRGIHHCRCCGQGVCAACSRHRQPVPKRGLDFPSRVCDQCFQVLGNGEPQAESVAGSSSLRAPEHLLGPHSAGQGMRNCGPLEDYPKIAVGKQQNSTSTHRPKYKRWDSMDPNPFTEPAAISLQLSTDDTERDAPPILFS